MKRFKIIEESRFVNKDEMGNIKGGALCGINNLHSACSGSSYMTCGPALVNGFDVSFCGATYPFTYITCGGTGVKYISKETCQSVAYYKVTTCGGNNIHRS